MDIERRSVTAAVELREEGGTPKIIGHGAVFGQLSEDLGGFRERILPGAFADVLGDDVRAMFNHDANFVLGRNRAGTLRLFEDGQGLGFEIDAPTTATIRDLVLEPIRRGDITQTSFSFLVGKAGQEWSKGEDGLVTRTIKKVSRLFDVGPVTFPAYPQTDVAVRELREWQAARPGQQELNFENARAAAVVETCQQCARLHKVLSRIEDRLGLLSAQIVR